MKVWKFALWWALFVQRIKRFRWKSTLKSDLKFDEKLTFCFKNDVRKLVNFNPSSRKHCCSPLFSLKISLRDTSFHISLISLGFHLFQECLLKFLSFVGLYSAICAKFFPIYGVHIPRKYIESIYFYPCPSPPLKTPGRIF